MTKTITIDEMLEVAKACDLPDYDALVTTVEHTADLIARHIETHYNNAGTPVIVGSGSFEGVAFAGTCVTFEPSYPGQPCPAALEDYDPGEWEDE